MTTFGLVHGAWHGAWSWDRLIPELRARGHDAVAMDLPADSPDATFQEYADVVIDALGDADDAVLVGHSLGAYTLPFVAARRPVRLLVYLCGVIAATPGSRDAADEPPFDDGVYDVLDRDEQGRSFWPGGTAASMYPDCTKADVAWAVARVRPQGRGIWRAFEPIGDLTIWPSVTVIGLRDHMVRPEWSRWAAERRLGGLTPIERDWGHFPMITDAPELADLLVSLVSA